MEKKKTYRKLVFRNSLKKKMVSGMWFQVHFWAGKWTVPLDFLPLLFLKFTHPPHCCPKPLKGIKTTQHSRRF